MFNFAFWSILDSVFWLWINLDPLVRFCSVLSDLLSGKFPRCPGRCFEKFWGLYNDRPRDRSLGSTSVRERKFGVVSPVRCGELGW